MLLKFKTSKKTPRRHGFVVPAGNKNKKQAFLIVCGIFFLHARIKQIYKDIQGA